MKKLAALTLAMVIALTMISALGEEGTDYSGIWYIITEDTTAGIAELNADGTMVWAPFKTADMAAGTVTMNADSKTVWTVTADGTASGTWEAADNGIKLFLEAGTLALALDSGALENSEREIKLSRETVQPKNVEKRFKSAFQPEMTSWNGWS